MKKIIFILLSLLFVASAVNAQLTYDHIKARRLDATTFYLGSINAINLLAAKQDTSSALSNITGWLFAKQDTNYTLNNITLFLARKQDTSYTLTNITSFLAKKQDTSAVLGSIVQWLAKKQDTSYTLTNITSFLAGKQDTNYTLTNIASFLASKQDTTSHPTYDSLYARAATLDTIQVNRIKIQGTDSTRNAPSVTDSVYIKVTYNGLDYWLKLVK